MKVLAIIPARGGSKGIKKKNLRKVGGKSLIQRAVEVSKSAKLIDATFVSTDDRQMFSHAYELGCPPVCLRPSELAGDNIGDLDVLIHGLEVMETYAGHQFNHVVMLQPTSPLRSSREVDNGINFAIKTKASAVWSLSEVDLKYHPFKALRKSESHQVSFMSPHGSSVITRQQLVPTFIRNGVFYVISRETLLKDKNLTGSNWKGIVLDGIRVSVDDEKDIELVERYINLYDKQT